MNRRGVFRRTWVTSPVMMLAVGLAAMAPRQATHELVEVAAQPAEAADSLSAAEPMRLRPAHDLDPPAPTPVPAATPSAAPPPAPHAGPVAAGPVTPRAPAAGAGRFAYGYCTWWVASRRPIPWTGNAWQWWGNARAFGLAEGSSPRPGAIMVMGISGSSPQGHVAYVEAVNADGSFTVSEMNWWGVPGGGWGRVDYRRVTSMAGVIGFIY
jgi:surface antigen